MKKLMLLIATFMFVMGSATVAFAQEPVKKAATEQTEENAEAKEEKEEEKKDDAATEEQQAQGTEAAEIETPTEVETPAETAE